MEVLAIARKLNGYGFTKLADKLVTRKYGAQIGKTSKAGYRAFCSNNAEPIYVNIGVRRVDRIDDMAPEKVITAIDKDYNLVGQTITRRMHKDPNNIMSYDCTQVERRLLPKSNDPAQTNRLDVTQYQGLGNQPQSGNHIVSRHYISRKALEPEKGYLCGDSSHRYQPGETIYESFSYSYHPKDTDGNIVMKYNDIGYINGGEKFYTRVRNMLDKWIEQHRVIRQDKI